MSALYRVRGGFVLKHGKEALHGGALVTLTDAEAAKVRHMIEPAPVDAQEPAPPAPPRGSRRGAR